MIAVPNPAGGVRLPKDITFGDSWQVAARMATFDFSDRGDMSI
jgi:hypothetical protein